MITKNNTRKSLAYFSCLRMLTLVLLFIFLSGCSKTELYSSLPENEVNDMMSILLRNGISVEKSKNKGSKQGNTFALSVASSDIAASIALFKKYGYPHEQFASIEDIFKKEGLVSSPTEERLRAIYALEQEIQETLSQIDGIITSRVKVVLPENNPFSETVSPSSASVYIKYIAGINISKFKSNIKLIVEKSVEGLEYDQVTVVMLPSRVMTEFDSKVSWERILGVRVPSESATLFISIITVFVLTIFTLIAYMLWLFHQQKRKKKEASIAHTNSNPSNNISTVIKRPDMKKTPFSTDDNIPSEPPAKTTK